MRSKKLVFLLGCFVLFAVSGSLWAAEEESARTFERYKSIIDRQPFGEPPEGFDPENPAASSGRGGVAGGAAGEMTEQERTEEEKRLAAVVRVSVLNVTPAGKVMVGFSDKSDAKAEKHFYMAVGETRAGWLVKDANPADESGKGSVTLSKDGIEVTLGLGEDSKSGGKAAARGARMGATPPMQAAPNKANMPRMMSNGGGLAGLRARREMQQRELAANRAAAEKAEADRKAAEAERKAEAEREKAEQDAAREEQRQQLKQIQEELKRQREEREKKAAEDSSGEKDAEEKESSESE